jgi:threonine aldolase
MAEKLRYENYHKQGLLKIGTIQKEIMQKRKQFEKKKRLVLQTTTRVAGAVDSGAEFIRMGAWPRNYGMRNTKNGQNAK